MRDLRNEPSKDQDSGCAAGRAGTPDRADTDALDALPRPPRSRRSQSHPRHRPLTGEMRARAKRKASDPLGNRFCAPSALSLGRNIIRSLVIHGTPRLVHSWSM